MHPNDLHTFDPSTIPVHSSITIYTLPLYLIIHHHQTNLLPPPLILPLKQPLDPINQGTQPAKQPSEPKRPPAHPDAPDEEVDQGPIADDKGEEDAKVAPLVRGSEVQRREVLVADAVLAVAARRRGRWVGDVARRRGQVRGGVAAARAAGWRVEVCQFGLGAGYGDAGEGGGEDASDPVG